MENQIVNVKNQAVTEHQNAVHAVANVSVIEGMSRAYKLAQVMCQAGNIPDNYKNKPADCMIAIDMAERMNVSPMFIFQNMYVVKGKPSWSGQACKALIDNCGKYRDVKHVYFGEKGTDSRGCCIEAIRISDGEVIRGVEVTIAMAKAEGWTSNKKWQNMPELMLAYRASAFFARVHCPEALMGCMAEGEADDIAEKNSAKDLSNALKGGKA